MILLFGGASETAPLANDIAALGHRVLVSKATDVRLDCGSHPNIETRSGLLTGADMVKLIADISALAVVDATHPFAAEARRNIREAAGAANITYLTYVRPLESFDYPDLEAAADHEEAARIAFSYGAPVLLTTGSRNLVPYAKQSRKTGLRVTARVLDHPSSLAACEGAGIPDDCVIARRGPFTLAQNLEHIESAGAGVIVTKASGAAGGVADKVEAAKAANCRLIVVDRPETGSDGAYDDMDALVEALKEIAGAGVAR